MSTGRRAKLAQETKLGAHRRGDGASRVAAGTAGRLPAPNDRVAARTGHARRAVWRMGGFSKGTARGERLESEAMRAVAIETNVMIAEKRLADEAMADCQRGDVRITWARRS